MNRIPTPRDIGLPEKFDRWRPQQEEMLWRLRTATTRVKAPCAPTGSGKSAVFVADSILSEQPTCIVTANNGLLKQYMDDFAEIGMASLLGRKNYTCKMKEGYTCEDGYNARCPYKGTVACDCSAAEMRAATSSLVVTNYAKWTSAKKYGQGMSHFKRVVFDEAHNAPGALAAAMQVVLTPKEINDGLGLDFLSGSAAAEMGAWKQWAISAKAYAEAAMTAAYARLQGSPDPKQAWIRHYSHMKNLCRRLSILALCRATDWVVEELRDSGGFQFDPIRPGRYAEYMLFMRTPDILMGSATLRPKTLFMCHVSKENFTFWEFASDFSSNRCPIYYVPIMRVDSRAEDLAPLWIKADQIAAKRRHQKGIINTVSFVRQGDLKSRSRFWDSMIVNLRGEPTAEKVTEYKEAGPGAIFVTPSVGEGYDFPGDECRWVMMCKIPFEPPSKIVKAREAADSEYRAYQAMQGLVQTFGRGMRSGDDYCEGFIGDMHMEWFLPKYGHLAPHSFHARLRRAEILPQPLNL